MRRGPAGHHHPHPHPEPRRRIPGMPAGAPTAAAQRRKEGASLQPGWPEGRPQPRLRPPPAPPHWTEAPAPGQGRGAAGVRETATKAAEPGASCILSAVLWYSLQCPEAKP